jgi:hypothetical protein
MYAHQSRRRWGHTAMRGWAKLVIDRRCLAGGGHSAWSAPPKAVDEGPDEAGALLLTFFFSRAASTRGSSTLLLLRYDRYPSRQIEAPLRYHTS